MAEHLGKVVSGDTETVSLGAAGTDTVIDVVVTAEDGETQLTYTITVHWTDEADEPTEPPSDLTLEFKLTTTSNRAWARVEVDWTVSGGSGEYIVKSELTLEGQPVDSVVSSVSGDPSSGTHERRERGGHGKTYEVTLTVTDS